MLLCNYSFYYRKFINLLYFQVVDESSARHEIVSESEKFYIVKSEWFWTRIAEGYAPEDDFLYKDVI
jgi:hypothetical protein